MDWGLQNRIAQIIKPTDNRALMLAVDHGERVWVTMKCNKQKIFPSKTGELEIIIIPTFNKHFYTANKKFYKKSISPILDKRKVLVAKILTLDGTIIGNESLLPNII